MKGGGVLGYGCTELEDAGYARDRARTGGLSPDVVHVGCGAAEERRARVDGCECGVAGRDVRGFALHGHLWGRVWRQVNKNVGTRTVYYSPETRRSQYVGSAAVDRLRNSMPPWNKEVFLSPRVNAPPGSSSVNFVPRKRVSQTAI